jgi:catechol 2,3-dioxygenase-like lactoylglutathione lyase family enzyme
VLARPPRSALPTTTGMPGVPEGSGTVRCRAEHPRGSPVAIPAVPDHVAIALPAIEPALVRWHDELGAGLVSRFHNHDVFRGTQLRYANGAKLELLAPSERDPSPDNFLRRFLDRFGTRVHHVTLRVPDLPEAIAELGRCGLEVVDVDLTGEDWKESFLRPSQVGGIVVQVAWAAHDDREFARRIGLEQTEPRPDAASLLGPLLVSDDLDRAGAVWSALGADVDGDREGFVARWDGSPLTVRVVAGEDTHAIGLRFTGTTHHDHDPTLGPPIIV